MVKSGSGSGPSNVSRDGGDGRPILLCFSHLRWNFVYQRPQHLLSRAVAAYDVLFVEEPVWHDTTEPTWESSLERGVHRLVPILPWGTDEMEAEIMQRELVDKLMTDWPGRPLTVWYYTPMAFAFSRHLDADLVVYDCMDELSAFRGAPPRLTELESALFDRADVVFTGGQSLFEAKRHRHPNVHAFPSSIDPKHFGQARRYTGGQPPDQADIPHPRLGFFGVIDERMDTGLVAAIADLRPDWHLVMIGPVVKIDEADLPQRANIRWLGGKSYDELPAYLAGWDLGLMPFAMNESTRFISPTKTPEYLAAGLPVISTPITDVVRGYGDAGLVEIADDADSIVAAGDRLLGGHQAGWLEQVDRRLAQSSWDTTWEAMHAQMRARTRLRREGLSAPLTLKLHAEPVHV